jgi:urease accessory protein
MTMLHRPLPTRLAHTVTPAAQYRLMAWLSPSFPVGAFSYSSGIEWAVEAGDIKNVETLQRWLSALLGMGTGFCDAVFLVHAHRAVAARDERALRGVAEVAAAFAPSKERHLESTAQGQAFVRTIQASWPCAAMARFTNTWDGPIAYSVAVGVACAGHDIPAEAAAHGYLYASIANLVSAGVRLIPLGQTDGQRIIASLETDVAITAERALLAELSDVGSCAFRADIASMRHETQYTRLFRT